MITLERYCYCPYQGTFGKLMAPEFDLFTVEQPWRGNQPFASCVPEGVYDLVWVDSPHFGETVALENRDLRVFASQDDATEPGDRFACLFHSANLASQLQGCIAPGEYPGVLNGEWAVLNSAVWTRRLLDHIKEDNIRAIHITHFQASYP